MNSNNAVHDGRTSKASEEQVFEKDGPSYKDLRRAKYSEKKRMEYRHISKRRD